MVLARGDFTGSAPTSSRAPSFRAPRQCAARAVPRRKLGKTDLEVPVLTFGTMLFGEGNTLDESHRLLDICMEHGVNAFDAAEMYPVPQRAETSGRSEEYLGQWLKGRRREEVIVMTKVAGPSGQMTWIRGGPQSLDAKNVREAIEGSLRRLGTDYIDLYQVHWPDRYVPMFGDIDYNPEYAYGSIPLEETLGELGRAVDQGKIRHVGLSNETPWGLMRALQLSEKGPGGSQAQGPVPRVAALQNAYSLLCRTFDAGLAECCHMEGVSLLVYSPLAMGLLTGKYTAEPESEPAPATGAGAGTGGAARSDIASRLLDPDVGPLSYGGPPEARLNRYRGRYAEAESRYGPRAPVVAATRLYAELARRHGMSPTELALRFVLDHPLVATAVFGASSEAQLRECQAAAGRDPLPEEVRAAIDRIHALLPNPTP